MKSNNWSVFAKFTQVYARLLLLKLAYYNDLFVDSSARKTGAGRALMLAAHEYAAKNRMARLDLTTAKDNLNVQMLYESLGWVRDEIFYTYNIDIS